MTKAFRYCIFGNSCYNESVRNKVVLEITFYSSVRETSRKLGVLLFLIVSRETQNQFLVNTVFCQIHVICVVFLTYFKSFLKFLTICYCIFRFTCYNVITNQNKCLEVTKK